ncbi:hypothetical protein [Butyrivibrio sp. M55]|uniref:hypothetical protein n=1 Tax=Butyrivibrio sp. M55 TaxID=1855323 RepID=UPI0008F21E6A|nr:hypothetical protein [Butyrivibrio sp. M55]SFU87650.1 hypothetical protein SAMN05216540_11615 [Butyrivibrio sp. M55]
MSDKEEFGKIRQIVDSDEYPEERNFADKVVKKFNRTRNLFYIVIIAESFYLYQVGKLFPENIMLEFVIVIAIPVICFMYLGQRNAMRRELNRYIFRECRPDIAISRYLSFVSRIINKQVAWNAVQYNLGCALYRYGRIGKAHACLSLMQESCETANSMMLAEHLKLLIALYYKDYDTVISCAEEANTLYPKAVHNIWIKKIYGDMQRAGDYAKCCKNNDYAQASSILQNTNERPLDEVTRNYYLFLTARELHDFEKIETYRDYVRRHAGTTWYGQAVEDGFVPEDKPENYPGFYVASEKLNKPRKVDRSRFKYFLIGVLIALLLYFLPRLLW